MTGLFDGLAGLALDSLDVNLIQSLHKQLAVFGIDDGLYGGAQHFHTVFFQHTALKKFDTAVQRRLSAKAKQNTVGAFLLDDPLHEIGLHGQEINLVGHGQIGRANRIFFARGLDRRNVRVDEHRLDTFLAQRLQRLTAGIVELAGLSYLQRTAAQQQHFLYILVSHNVSIKRSNINSVSTGPEQASGWNWLLNQGFV